MFNLVILFAIAAFSPNQAGMLKFAKGEVMKYKSTLSGSNTASFKGSTQAATFKGSNIMTVAVTSVTQTSASMKVTYSNAQGNVTITALPPEMKSKKAEIEKQISQSLKAGLNSGDRTQTTNSRGVTTYNLSLGDGKTMSISEGAFLMLVLPAGGAAPGKTWTANVRLPAAEASGSMKVQYKCTGIESYAGQQCYKITFTSSDSQSGKQGEVTMSMRASVSGTIYLSQGGKVLYGDVKRTNTATLTHAKEGTRTQKQESVQTFTKI